MEEAKILHECALGLTARQNAFSEDETPPYMVPREDPLVVCARVRSVSDGATHWQTEASNPTSFRNQVEQVLPMLTLELVLDFHVKERAAIARAVVTNGSVAGTFLARMAHTPTNAQHAVAVRYSFKQIEGWIERAFCLLVNTKYPQAETFSNAAASPDVPVQCPQETPVSAEILMGVD